MAHRALWAASVAAALAGVLADTLCFMEGKKYIDGAVTANMPNGAFVQEPYLCRQRCQQQVATVGCVGFTWMKGPAEATALHGAIGPGGCWLVGDNATLVDMNATEHPGRVVSGPAECDPESTGAPSASTEALSAPTEAPDNTTGNSTDVIAAEGAGGEGGSASMWLFIGVAITVLGIGAGVFFASRGGGKTKASRQGKRKEKRTRANNEVEPTSGDVETCAGQAPLLPAALMPQLQAPTLQVPGSPGAGGLWVEVPAEAPREVRAGYPEGQMRYAGQPVMANVYRA